MTVQLFALLKRMLNYFSIVKKFSIDLTKVVKKISYYKIIDI